MREIWIPLAAQVILAALGTELFRLRVLPGLKGLEHPGLVLDVWGPLSLVLPLLFMAGWIDGRVSVAGWPAIGGPVILGVLALALALSVGGLFSDRDTLSRLAIASWTGAGLVLLLQSAASEMTLWTGQCSFAAAAVLLWMNTPAPGPTPDQPSRASIRVGWALLLAILLSVGQGWVALSIGEDGRPFCLAVVMIYAVWILAMTAGIAGPDACMRVGGWAAGYGALLGLGLVSICVLLPEVYHILADRFLVTEHGWPRPPVVRVAYGFGAFALEGTLLVLLAGAWALAGRWPAGASRAVSIAVLLVGLSMLIFRLLRMM